MPPLLFSKVQSAGLPVTHACEVGVYLPEQSNVLGWIESGVRTTLVECDPGIATALRTRFGSMPHVRLEEVAVADEPGVLTMYRAGASTFGSNVPKSPALINDGFEIAPEKTFEVPAVTFDTIDDGTIDLLSIDIEGGEWFVLRHLTSRPTVISLETHGKRYVNPYLAEIQAWLRAEGYGPWYRDRSDTVYRKGYVGPVENHDRDATLFGKIKKAIRGW